MIVKKEKKMSETLKLYYEDPYLQEFEAVVTGCSPAGGNYAVTLDRTAFYPEGGGQPGDTGTLGNAAVLDTIEKDDSILHITDSPLTPGSTVIGCLDFDRRFDFMQQHSGEHIVSGLVCAAFGCHNVGFHMGTDVVTIDFDCVITEDELRQIEAEANRRIWSDRKTEILYPAPEELESIEYRSKKELTGQVRLVCFPGTDICACCGIHVERTGEIGMVKILSVVNFRDGVRVEMISGQRVYSYLNAVSAQNSQISVLLSAKISETAQAVKRLHEENYQLRSEISALQEASFALEAERQNGAGNVLLFKEALSSDNVRRLTDAVMNSCGGRCAVFSDNGDGSFKYAIGEKGGDLRSFTKEMNHALNGRGGGKPFFVQGSVKAEEQAIRDFFSVRQTTD